MPNKLKMPAPDSSGLFVPTLNNMGYMTTNLDPYSSEFVEYACKGRHVLEIGAAYGVATLAALSNGAKVTCNDIENRHLEILKNQVDKKDIGRLILVPANFPEELNFPENSFDAILICRVLHLFNSETIERGLRKTYDWLKPSGKLFIVADTPYLKIFKDFIPEYEDRRKRGEKWPGLIDNTNKYLAGVKNTEHIPQFVHLLDEEVIARCLIDNHFKVEKISTFSRIDYPPDRRLDGRENLGLIAVKS